MEQCLIVTLTLSMSDSVGSIYKTNVIHCSAPTDFQNSIEMIEMIEIQQLFITCSKNTRKYIIELVATNTSKVTPFIFLFSCWLTV